MFILHLSLLLTPGVARQSYWSNLGRSSKTFRNTGLHQSLCT